MWIMIKLTINEYFGDSSRDMTVECDSLTEALCLLQAFNENEAQKSVQNMESKAQKSVSGEKDGIDWSQAPEWATMYGYMFDSTPAWASQSQYQYLHGDQNDIVFTFDSDGATSWKYFTQLAKREL